MTEPSSLDNEAATIWANAIRETGLWLSPFAENVAELGRLIIPRMQQAIRAARAEERERVLARMPETIEAMGCAVWDASGCGGQNSKFPCLNCRESDGCITYAAAALDALRTEMIGKSEERTTHE